MNPAFLPKTLSASLGWLIEECAEVQAEVGKTIRFGLWSSDPRKEKRSTTGTPSCESSAT